MTTVHTETEFAVMRHTELKYAECCGPAFRAMTLTAFANWLHSQPATRMYPGDPDTETISSGCPIASFCGHPSASYMRGMPDWASRFIELFDRQIKPRTQSKALAVLAVVEAEFS